MDGTYSRNTSYETNLLGYHSASLCFWIHVVSILLNKLLFENTYILGKNNFTTHIYTQEKHMSNTSKSGFEIRAELLSLSEGLLTSNYQREVDAIYAHNDSFPNDKKPLPLREITGEEVIRTARQLNEFVTEK
tara:strand:+ start:1412 stop:1810 length:399 start_codon:yes stop_codon:yes gene_type:complete